MTCIQDFCALVVPLINFTKLSNRVSRAVSWIMPSAANGSHESRSALADDICLICVAREGSGAVGILAEDCRAYNPYETSCRHVFCYYCIKYVRQPLILIYATTATLDPT